MKDTYQITTEKDWENLSKLGFTTVIDPLVVRAGELFFRDLDEYEDKNQAYNFLDKNIHSLGTFVDTLILSDGIPVFNYNASYREGFLFGKELVEEINQEEEIIKEVDVQSEAYDEVKNSAIEEVEKIYNGEKKIEPKLTKDILSELSDSRYSWTPYLGDNLEKLQDDDEKRIAALLLGGTIFNGYAKKLGGERIIQPKRSRLFLSATLKVDRGRFEDESKIFEKLKKYGKNYHHEIPWTPSFFH